MLPSAFMNLVRKAASLGRKAIDLADNQRVRAANMIECSLKLTTGAPASRVRGPLLWDAAMGWPVAKRKLDLDTDSEV